MTRRGTNCSQSLCWDCAKACGKCSWSQLPQRPVAKSKVEYFETVYYRNNRLVGRLRLGRVLKCPEFEEG